MYPGRKTAADTTRKLVRRFYDQFWNAGHEDAAPRIVAPDAVIRGTLGAAAPGPQGLVDYAHRMSDAFGDLRMEVQEVIVDRDRAAARITLTGTHRAEALGCPASGHRVRHECVALFRTAHGRIVEVTVHGDLSALREQLLVRHTAAAGGERHH